MCATVTPWANGEGYTSVRIRPARADIEAAEALYRRMNAGEKIILREGLVINPGLSASLSALFGKMTIATQLWLMAIFTSTLLLTTVLLGNYAMQVAAKSAIEVSQGKNPVADILPPPLYILEANFIAHSMLDATPYQRNQQQERLLALKSDYDARNKYWEASELEPKLKASLLGEQRTQADRWWQAALGSYIPAIQRGDIEGAHAALVPMDTYYDAHRAGVDATVKLGLVHGDQAVAALSGAGNKPVVALIAIAVFGCVASLLVAFVVIRKLSARMRIAGEVINAIAGGDLTRLMPPASHDEVGNLMVQISIMRNSLHELIAALHQNVEALNHSAYELSQAAGKSAHSSETQSEAASSMAAAVEQMSVSVDMVEENAREAHAVTQASSTRSTEGGRIIHEAATEMERIAAAVTSTASTIRELEEYSGQISSIAGTIKDIADQTNLLALNAAIEAARAGEQGRGFAVVADEVRKLAERTAQSTTEITSMIGKIQEGTQRAAQEMENGVSRVSDGVRLAREAGDSISGIRDGAIQVTHAVDEISYALKEQATAAREIAQKVEQIAQGSEENSASAAQTSASARDLEVLSRQLRDMAARFRIA